MTTIALVLIPAVALLIAAAATLKWQPGEGLLSAFQHFAAGVVTAAVALELLPAMLETQALVAMLIGYLAGLGAMLLVDRLAARLGAVVPTAIDLFIDGLLLMIGFAAGRQGGEILLLGLTMETVALGLAIAPGLSAMGMSPRRILVICALLGATIVGGALSGRALPLNTPVVLALVLGFGVAALLYLVIEELMREAHEKKDSAAITAVFFLGFLLPIAFAQLSGSG